MLRLRICLSRLIRTAGATIQRYLDDPLGAPAGTVSSSPARTTSDSDSSARTTAPGQITHRVTSPWTTAPGPTTDRAQRPVTVAAESTRPGGPAASRLARR